MTDVHARLADLPLPTRDRLIAEVWAFLVERGYTIIPPGLTDVEEPA